MSSFTVTLEKVKVRPHPNAERLELARVGMFDAVVGKGQFKEGDVAFYIPEQAILPENVVEALGLTGKLTGKEKNRVKAISLRGSLSQGIVTGIDLIEKAGIVNADTNMIQALIEDVEKGNPSNHDFSELFGITKWEVEIPIHLSGAVESGQNLLPWIDIENIKRYPDIFTKGEAVSVSEKLHGTCLLATIDFNGDVIVKTTVSSKGLGDKKLALTESPDNLYWRAVNNYPVRELALELAQHYSSEGAVNSVGIYGEVYGAGIQDLGYGVKGGNSLRPGFAVFDAYIRMENGEGFWVPAGVIASMKVDVPRVPVLFEGAYDFDHIASIASGREQMSGTEANIREGVVIRSVNETEWIDAFENGHRKIAKFVTEEYITRKGGTEFQ